MPVATKNENKSGFVKEFLSDHPDGNVKAVNDAWTAAGMKGGIGATLIYKTRAEMGLSGQLRAKANAKTAARAKSPTKMSEAASSPGKTMFVKEFLRDHPQGNLDAVNEAWQAAGFDGAISRTLVDKMRARLGLTGNLRGNTEKKKTSVTGKKPGQPRQQTTATVNGKSAGQPLGSNSDRTSALLGVEAEIDQVIFQVMSLGDLREVETALRDARRQVYRALSY